VLTGVTEQAVAGGAGRAGWVPHIAVFIITAWLEADEHQLKGGGIH